MCPKKKNGRRKKNKVDDGIYFKNYKKFVVLLQIILCFSSLLSMNTELVAENLEESITENFLSKKNDNGSF